MCLNDLKYIIVFFLSLCIQFLWGKQEIHLKMLSQHQMTCLSFLTNTYTPSEMNASGKTDKTFTTFHVHHNTINYYLTVFNPHLINY